MLWIRKLVLHRYLGHIDNRSKLIMQINYANHQLSTVWGKENTWGDHKALSWYPYHSQHKSYTAGKWSPSRSTTRIGPRWPLSCRQVCSRPMIECQGWQTAPQDINNYKIRFSMSFQSIFNHINTTTSCKWFFWLEE